MSAQKLSERLRVWFANGEKGMQTLCDIQDTPEHIKDAVTRWYSKGHVRLDAIISDLEKLENARDS